MRYIVLFIALFLPICAIAQEQEDDKGTLVRLLQDSLSGAGRDVVIDGFQGALSSQATLEQMTIADADGVWLTLRGATLDWSRAALLRGRVDITKLTAEEILLVRLPASEPSMPSPEATPFTLPELPVSITIEELKVDKMALGKEVMGYALQASLDGALALADGQGKAVFNITRTDEITGHITLNGAFANETRVLDIDLRVNEDPGGLIANLAQFPDTPSVALTIAGSGPLDAIETRIALDTDAQPRLRGTVVTQNDPETMVQSLLVDVGGDLAPLFAPEYRAVFWGSYRAGLGYAANAGWGDTSGSFIPDITGDVADG